jgi:hypothetical protein
VHNRRHLWTTRSAGLAAVLLLTAGCADQPGTEDASSTGSAASSPAAEEVSDEAAATTSSSDEPTADPSPFPADASVDVADPVDPDGLTVTAARAARHEGYDRVVFELAGTGTPGWRVEYVDAPTAEGSGAAVDVPGEAYLQVTLQGTTYPYESGAEEVPRGPVSVSGTEMVQGVVYGATFEGTSVAWIGTGSRTPFRVYALTGPSRVVVEVAG